MAIEKWYDCGNARYQRDTEEYCSTPPLLQALFDPRLKFLILPYFLRCFFQHTGS